MAVFIQQPDALDLLTQVEGQGWRQMQDEAPFGICCFHAFWKEWKKADAFLDDQDKASEWYQTENLLVDGNSTIYGAGGYNRYLVKYTGEIILVRRQAWGEEAIKRAEAAGFRVTP